MARNEAAKVSAELRTEAKRRARLLQYIPREQLVERIAALTEEIRKEAIQKGTAIVGDWVGD